MTSLANFERALVLAPHTDDGELGAGGAISRLREAGVETRYVAFSSAGESVPEGLPSDVLKNEVAIATKVLGLDSADVAVLDYRVRHLAEHRQEILEYLVGLRNQYQPDLVIMPSTRDIHQDHVVVANEGIRAFKYSTILSYEIPWNNLSFTVSGFVHLEKRHVDIKVEALAEYRSQADRPYMEEEFIRSQARFRGVQSGAEFAEAFDVVRLVM